MPRQNISQTLIGPSIANFGSAQQIRRSNRSRFNRKNIDINLLSSLKTENQLEENQASKQIEKYKPIDITLPALISSPTLKLGSFEIQECKDYNLLNSDKLEFLFSKFNVFVHEKIKIDNSNIQQFKSEYYSDPLNRINKNIELFHHSCIINKLSNNNFSTLVINENVALDYLPFYKYSLHNIFENSSYDIVELSILDSQSNFEFMVQQDIGFYPLEEGNSKFHAYAITPLGISKILDNQRDKYDLLKDCKIGYFSRPLFYHNTFISTAKNLWYSFYRVTSKWEKVYCINLGFEIQKKEQMRQICRLVNCFNDDFFYNGILGVNLPHIDSLIKNQIFHPIIKKRYPKLSKGAIGLNVTQQNIINDCVKAEYSSVLIFEDDVKLPLNYFTVLDKLFNKYNDIDILYLGFSNNEPSIVLDVIDNINGYEILRAKNILRKVKIGGFFGVYLSKKALKIYQTKFNPIQDISDVWLCNLAFNIDLELNDQMKKSNHNLNVLFIRNLCQVDVSKASLTEENNFNFLQPYRFNREIQYMSKIKKIQYMVKNNYIINIYVSNTFKIYYKKFLKLLNNLIPNVELKYSMTDDIDIALYTIEDYVELDNTNLNIIINGEKESKIGDFDIGILTTYDKLCPINIYYPFMWISLWERRHNFNIIKHNTMEKFCAYMYNYDIEYRVQLFHLISKYKKVDALGKSQNNVKLENDRSTYNDNVTYNDLAVEKYSKYKFVLALENGFDRGYVTEKLINPILAGSIPIYSGSNEIFYLINKKRIIFVGDYESDESKLVEEIKRLDQDSDLYKQKVNEPIFSGNINFSNFEEHLTELLKPALGFLPKTISFNKSNVDLQIKDLKINYNNDLQTLYQYLNDFIIPGDQIV